MNGRHHPIASPAVKTSIALGRHSNRQRAAPIVKPGMYLAKNLKAAADVAVVAVVVAAGARMEDRRPIVRMSAPAAAPLT
jgi:hypothetical protein